MNQMLQQAVKDFTYYCNHIWGCIKKVKKVNEWAKNLRRDLGTINKKAKI